MSTSRYCSFDGAAWTDLIPNSTLLTGIDVVRDWDLLTQAVFPRPALSSFIHEGVHHWSFLSVVGSALALLRKRALSDALRWTLRHDSVAGQRAIEDLMRFDVASTLLRSLAEGLALFAEHDVTPTPRTPVVSRPMLWTYWGFARPSREESETSWGESLIRLLQELRFDQANVRRKASLLVGPLDSYDGGYLTGYLAVKTLYILATRKDNRLWDTDLFCTFLRRYIYSDYGFVNVLLDQNSVGPEAWEAIAEYFQRRLATFKLIDFSPDLDEFIHSQLEEPQPLPEHITRDHYRDEGYAPIAIDAKLAAAGRQALMELLEELRRDSEFNAASGVEQRHLMRLCSVAVDVEEGSGGTVRAKSGQKLLFEGAAIAAFASGARGSLDLYLSMSFLFEAIALSVDGQLIALDFRGELPPQLMRDEVQFYAMDRVRGDALETRFNAFVRNFIEVIGFESEFNGRHQELVAAVTEIYANETFGAWVPPERRSKTLAAMRSDGFFKLVGGNLDLVQMLAALSIAGTMHLDAREAAQVFPNLPMTVDRALALFLRSEKEFGYPLVSDREPMLASYV